jgi:predicted DNA-binding WGR domain protein
MRRFELVEDTSSKFWEVDCEDKALTVRFGRIGTNGQVQTKTFPTAAKAAAERDKLIREKTKKGYVEKKVSPKGAASREKASDQDNTGADSNEPAHEAPSRAKPSKEANVAKDASPEPGWLDAGKGYRLALRDGKLVCKNARGQVLASVPKEVRDGDAGEQLGALVEWLKEHDRECIAAVETWMLRSLPTPRAVLESIWVDASWRAALEDTVVAPLDAAGHVDIASAGFLRGIDPAKGIGFVNLDGETVWSMSTSVAVPHPILLDDLDDFRALGVELSFKQGISQLFREIFRRGKDVDDDATSIGEFRNGKFAQLNHALGLCRRLGYRVRGGSAIARTWEGARVCEARFWIGSDDPMGETYTDTLVWVDDKDRTLKLRDVGPVAFSEGMRMASAVFAGRVVAKEGQDA